MTTRPEKDQLPFAEEVSYWRSGSSSPEKWLEGAARLIQKRGGRVLLSASGLDQTTDRLAYCLRFQFQDDVFSVVWPVLNCKRGKPADTETMRKRQAATMLFHDVKAKLMAAEVLGARRAFFAHLVLPDGRTIVDHAQDVAALPQILDSTPRLTAPEAQP